MLLLLFAGLQEYWQKKTHQRQMNNGRIMDYLYPDMRGEGSVSRDSNFDPNSYYASEYGSQPQSMYESGPYSPAGSVQSSQAPFPGASCRE